MLAGRARLFRALSKSTLPPPAMSVAEWAEAKRFVADESGSPHAGQWKNTRTPYLVEVMECLSFDHPCRSVTLLKSHQVGGTEVGINLIGYTIDLNPSVVLVVMASLDEGSKYSQLKLQPTIEASPSLRHKVRDQRSRSEQGSTTSRKKFAGGFLQVTGANSAKGLKMISVRVLICDEISDWPKDVDNQGDPLSMAEKRCTAHSHSCKKLFVSTPSVKGACRVTEKYEASDQRRLYVPCPQCDAYQHLSWDQMRWQSRRAPHRAYMVCASCGGVIEHYEKQSLLERAVWIKTYDDGEAGSPAPEKVIPAARIEEWRRRPSNGREPGFHIWQAYSLFVDWDDTVAAFIDAEGKPLKEKDFNQQVLGEAHEEASDTPDVELLVKAREAYPFRQVPLGALVLTGFVDVQGNRLEYGVYAWGPRMEGWHIDRGIIEGDPSDDAVWAELSEVMDRQYNGPGGHKFIVDAWGVDSGYLSHDVYHFTRSRPRVFATDGRDGWKTPNVGTPVRVDVDYRGKKVRGGAMLYPLGTFSLKSWVHAGLRKWLDGQREDGSYKSGTLHFSEACDKEFFEQITAEAVVTKENKWGRAERVWAKLKNRANEQLDIAVGARAMASHLGLDLMSEDNWREVAVTRGAKLPAQGDLLEGQFPASGEAKRSSAIERLAKLSQRH
ncbi:MAG: phage terminase large subunit family protein [Parvibaculaceae bacterium]|nr:phage terminase large subunit family protein [Parvibaculaceae bacterium]